MKQTIRYGSAPSQFLQLHWPTTPSSAQLLPLAFVIHGGFWKEQYGIDPPTAAIDSLPPALTALGYLVALPEYRRVSEAAATPAVWGPGYTDADVAAAFALVLANPRVDRDRIVVLGHSAGATLALSLPPPHPQLIIAVAPVGDLCRAAQLQLSDNGDAVQRYMRGEPPYANSCPACRANDLVVCDLIVLSGAADTDVPINYVRDFYSTISSAFADSAFNCDIRVIPDADHYDVVNASSIAAPALLSIFRNFAAHPRDHSSTVTQLS